jgi:hypothetical protein
VLSRICPEFNQLHQVAHGLAEPAKLVGYQHSEDGMSERVISADNHLIDPKDFYVERMLVGPCSTTTP